MEMCEYCGQDVVAGEVENERLCKVCIDDWLGEEGITEQDNKRFNDALSKVNLALMDYEATLKALGIPASLDHVYEGMNTVTSFAEEEGFVVE